MPPLRQLLKHQWEEIVVLSYTTLLQHLHSDTRHHVPGLGYFSPLHQSIVISSDWAGKSAQMHIALPLTFESILRVSSETILSAEHISFVNPLLHLLRFWYNSTVLNNQTQTLKMFKFLLKMQATRQLKLLHKHEPALSAYTSINKIEKQFTLQWSKTTMHRGSLLIEDKEGSISGATVTGSSWSQNVYLQNTKLERCWGKPVAWRILI